MSKLKALTEDKYTLNDIFTKNHEKWLLAPLFIYLLTPIVHMIVYACLYSPDIIDDQIDHFIKTGEYPGDYYSPIIQFSFIIGAVVAAAALISHLVYSKQNKIKRSADSIPVYFFCAYALLIIISTIVNKTDKNLIFGFTPRAEGVLSLMCYFFIFYLCGSLVRKEKYKYAVIYFFLATGVVIGILTLINEYVTDVTIIGDEYVSGIFYTHNFYAYYLSITIMLSAGLASLEKSTFRKIAALAVMCFNTFILAINDSLGGFLACSVAFVFLIAAVSVKKHKFAWQTLLMFALFLAIVYVTGLFTQSFFSELGGFGSDVEDIVTNAENAGDAGTYRWTLWTHTAQYIKEKPWLGWGFEGTAERLGTETHTDKAHNEYLENMAYFGIPAGLLYLGGLISVYIKALKRRKVIDAATVCCLAGALGYIGSALVGNSFIFTSPFFFIFLGLANNTREEYISDAENSEQ